MAPHTQSPLVPCSSPYTPPQPPASIGTECCIVSIVTGQVWPPNNMVQMGVQARGNTSPHHPRAFNLPAPSPPAVAQLISS